MRAKGACRALCLEAAKLERRREVRVGPDDLPAQLDLERWGLLEEVLAPVPGTESRPPKIGYEHVGGTRVALGLLAGWIGRGL